MYINVIAINYFQNVHFTNKYLQRCLHVALDNKPNKTLSAPYLLQVWSYSPYFWEVCRLNTENFPFQDIQDQILHILILLANTLMDQFKRDGDSSEPKVTHGLFFSIRHLLQNRNME